MAIEAEQAKQRAKACCRNPKLVITYLWFTILFFAFLYSLGAIVTAANNNGNDDTDNKSLGFAGIWMMLLVIALSVGGTMVMRKYQTPLAVGFFIGVVVMMAFNMFSMCVLFAGASYTARKDPEGDGDTSSDDASAAFSFFLFVLYSIFAVVLIKHRNIIIKDPSSTTEVSLPERVPPVTTAGSIPAPTVSTTQKSPTNGNPPVSV